MAQNNNVFSMNIPPLPHGTNNIPGNATVAVRQNMWSPTVLTNYNTAEKMVSSANVRFGRKNRKSHKNRKSRKVTRRNKASRKNRKN